MKVERKEPEFMPVVITLETREDLTKFLVILESARTACPFYTSHIVTELLSEIESLNDKN